MRSFPVANLGKIDNEPRRLQSGNTHPRSLTFAARYRQVLDGDFEKLSALITDKTSDEKHGKNSTNEHAVFKLNGIEIENRDICATAMRTKSYNEVQSGAKAPRLPKLTPTGIEPVPRP